MKTSKTSLSFIVFISVVCFLLSPTLSVAKIYHLTILHTNDHQGHFMKFSWDGIPDVGGMAAQSTLVNIVRAEVEQSGGHVLLLSAGGVNTGAPESDLLNAEPDFKLMTMLGYDAMVLGLFEFHTSRKVLLQQREWAGFPFLSANTVRRETGEPLVDPYIIKAFDGLNVAILGLTDERVSELSHSVQEGDWLSSRNVIEVAQAFVPKLREQADLVIALTHIHFDAKQGRATGQIQLAEAVPEIDVIIGGLSQIILEEPVVIGQTLILQAGNYGRYVGRLDLTIDNETDTIVDYAYKLIPVNLKQRVEYQGKSYYIYVDTGYLEDPEVLEVIQHYLKQTDETLSEVVGETLVRLEADRRILWSQEANLANLITDSLRTKTGAEITFFPSGAIALQMSIDPGPLTYRDILAIHPYGNTLVLLDMTGEQVMEVLRDMATINPGNAAFLHVSGLRWTNKQGIAEDVIVGDVPLDRDRMYKVVTNSFLAAGGFGYTMFKDAPQYDTGFTDASALREYIKKAGKVAPKVEGRLTIIE